MIQRIQAILLFISWFLPQAPAQQFRVMQFDAASGLPQPYVYSLDQDESGYLWIGTGNGLARFNGKAFTVYTTEDSLCDNFVSCSHINRQGAWFGHMNGGVTRYKGGIFKKIVTGGQATGAITDIRSVGDITWAGTQSGGIWRISPDQPPLLYHDPDNPVSIFALEFLSSTECLAGSIDGVYLFAIELEPAGLRLIGKLEGIPDTRIQDLMASSDGENFHIVTQDEGIFIYNTGEYSLQTHPLVYDREAGIEGPQKIFEDSRMNLWVPTFGSGLYKLIRNRDGGYSSWVNYHEGNGIPGNNVKTVMQDREENIWLGMYGTGLARLVDEAYTYFTFEDAEGSNNIHSIFISDQYGWFGTDEGLIRMNRSDGTIRYLPGGTSGIPADVITALAVSAEDVLWAGTSSNGVYRKQPGDDSFRKYFISSGILENAVNAMEIAGNLVWVATEKGVCKIDAGSDHVKWFTISNAGLPHNTVNDLKVDETGRVWLSTLSNTVSYIEKDSVTRMVIPTVGAALNIRSITMDLNGNVWVGTYGNGVFRLEGDSAYNYTTDRGLISDYCYSLVGDDRRYIWVSHRGGLSRIRFRDGFVSTVQEEVGIDRGMEFNLNAVFKDREGVIWFGSTSGVLSYDPRMEKSQSPPPALSITSVTVNNRRYDAVKQLELPPGRHDLRIQFVGVNLRNPEAVTYRYYMEGLGNAWSEPFSETQKEFNKLPDGKFTFRLKAENSEGFSNEKPVELSIVIAKPLWKRWWFYLLMLMLLTTGIIFYIKRREYNLRMEKQVLEKAVQERTEEVVKQKEEIESQRDAIKSQSDKIRLINKNITDSITYARRIQQAVFPPSELLTSYFPDSFVMNRPQYIVSGDFFWVTRKEERLIVTVADCTGHGVPGAFMSMLGITLLNELVNNQGIVDAALILNRLKHEIIRALRQKGSSESATDGMDMALCVYDPAASALQYAGGFNPLVLLRDSELTRYRADPMPIGIGAITGREFTRHDIDIRKGDVIYLYSDGYEDQFGGEKDKKFSRKRFRNLLTEIHVLPMEDQKKTLESRLDSWMDGREQIDDITVMGIRF